MRFDHSPMNHFHDLLYIFYFSVFHSKDERKRKLIAQNNCSGISAAYFNSMFHIIHIYFLLSIISTRWQHCCYHGRSRKKKENRKKCVDIKENCVRLWAHLMTFYKVFTLIKNFYLYFSSIVNDIRARYTYKKFY